MSFAAAHNGLWTLPGDNYRPNARAIPLRALGPLHLLAGLTDERAYRSTWQGSRATARHPVIDRPHSSLPFPLPAPPLSCAVWNVLGASRSDLMPSPLRASVLRRSRSKAIVGSPSLPRLKFPLGDLSVLNKIHLYPYFHTT